MGDPEPLPIRTLRNDVASVMKRVETGESFHVTRHGRPVARLLPMSGARRWKTTEEFRSSAIGAGSDPEFLELIRELRSEPHVDPYERWER